MTSRSPLVPLLLAAALGLAACGEPSPAAGDAEGAGVSSEPATGDVLTFLLERYDANADGRVTPAEYTRNRQGFARLDANADGALDAEDFPEESVEEPEERATRLIARYFQTNRRPDHMYARELEKAFAAYDSNGDGELSEAEFRSRMASCLQVVPGDESSDVERLMKGVDPWEGLVAGLAEGPTTELSFADFAEFFDARAEGGRWIFRAPELHELLGHPTIGRPLQGAPAPPFRLPTLHGDEFVALEDFRGSRPVALIFGSYT